MRDNNHLPTEGEAGDPQLPALSEALLDPAILDQLLADIASCAQLLEVVVKGGSQRRASGARADLEEARRLLAGGEIRGLQLRYRFEGVEWWDTLMRAPEGIRLVRIGHTWGEEP